MNNFLCFVLLVVMVHPAFGALKPNGDYSIRRGLSANNFEYTGKVVILQNDRAGDLYHVIWKIPNSEEYRGIGLLDHGKFFVAYSSSSIADFGLIIYKIEGGKLAGRWVTPKQDLASGSEELQGPAGLDGTYNVHGQSKNSGDTYSGTIEIHPFGQVYNLNWDVEGYTYTGVGIKEGNYLIAAWGPDAGIMSYDINGAELLGRWAAAGANRQGIEELVRLSPSPKSNGVTVASPIEFAELAKRIEKALAQINTMTWDEVLRYRPPGADNTQNTDLIKSKSWYKKPGLSRSESVTLYLPTGPRNNVYISKLEGENYDSYELLTDGSVRKSTFPADGWKAHTPNAFYADIHKRIKGGSPYSLEFDQSQNIYVLKFDSLDEAVFEIAGDSWLPYSSGVFDQKNNSIVEKVRSNIKINPKIPDETFRVP